MTTWTENNPASSASNVEANTNIPKARVTGDGYSYPVEGDLWYADIDFTHWNRNTDAGSAPTEQTATGATPVETTITGATPTEQ